MPGGGVILQAFTVTLTANGTQAMPNRLAGLPAAYAWGPAGTSVAGQTNTRSGGAGGSGSFGGEPAYAGVGPGTVLTATVPAAGSGSATTITGGSVTVTGNAGTNASGITAGTPGAASSNTIAFAGGTSGNGSTGTGTRGGGGAGGSAGSTGAGGNGTAGSLGAAGSGGAAGTGAAGPPSLAGAAGGGGGVSGANGVNGGTPGAAGGGGGSTSGGASSAGTSQGGQAIIEWQTLLIIPAPVPRRNPGRAVIFARPAKGTAPPPPPSGTVQPWPTIRIPRRTRPRGVSRGTAVPGIYGPVFPQQPRTAVPPRRRAARAVIPLVPVTGTPPPVTAGAAAVQAGMLDRRPGYLKKRILFGV